MKKIIYTLLLLITPLFSQDFTVQILVYDAEKLQTLYFSDLDLLQDQLAEELFEVRLTKISANGYDDCTMFIEIFRNDELITRSQSEKFNIPADPAGTTYQTTNSELLNNNFFFNPADPHTQVRFQGVTIEDAATDLQQDILASGKLPVGIYKILLRIESPSGDKIALQEEILIRASNPSYVQLIAPGNMYGSGEPAEVYNQYPLFQWNGNGVEYVVSVYEKKALMQSLDDILNSTPDWQSERVSEFSLQYPQAGPGVIPLSFGKTYYWLVTMYVATSSGDEAIRSEIWQFRLVDPANVDDAHGLEAKKDVIQFLRDLIGDQAEEVANELDGYTLRTILVNGESVSLEALLSRLRSPEYLNKNIEVIDLELR